MGRESLGVDHVLADDEGKPEVSVAVLDGSPQAFPYSSSIQDDLREGSIECEVVMDV